MSPCSWLWLALILIIEVVGALRISKLLLRKEETYVKLNSTSYFKTPQSSILVKVFQDMW